MAESTALHHGNTATLYQRAFEEISVSHTLSVLDRAVHTDQWTVNISRYFEDQVKDPQNFGLEENAASIIASVCTGLSMILFIDLSFRIVVRVRAGEISKYAVYRNYLMKEVTNPLSVISAPFKWSRIQKIIGKRRPTEGQLQQDSAREEYSLYKKALITLLGFFLIAAELAIIFFSTSQNRRYSIDVSRVPAFEVDYRQKNLNFPLVLDGCVSVPFTTKPGFKSNGNLNVCNQANFQPVPPLNQTANSTFFLVSFAASNKMIRIIVETGEWGLFADQSISTTAPSGKQYVSDNRITPADCRNSMDAAFEGHQIKTLQRTSYEGGEFFAEISLIDPRGFLSAEEYEQSMVAEVRLVGLMRSLLHTSGENQGFIYSTDGPPDKLTDVDDDFVINQRPWLSIMWSIILVSALLIASILLNVIGWEGSIDDRWAFKELFTDTPRVKDIGRGPDETLKLGWSADGNGNWVLGYVQKLDTAQPPQ